MQKVPDDELIEVYVRMLTANGCPTPRKAIEAAIAAGIDLERAMNAYEAMVRYWIPGAGTEANIQVVFPDNRPILREFLALIASVADPDYGKQH